MTLSIINYKGGTGKTTTTINLGVALSKRKKVLLIDFDPQANLSSSLGVESESETSVLDLLNKKSVSPVQVSKNLFVIPTDYSLAAFETASSNKPARDLILHKALKSIQDRYNYILIDCPPQLGFLTFNALCASNKYLIPSECEVLSLYGLVSITEVADQIADDLNKNLSLLGVLPTKYDKRKVLHRNALAKMQSLFDHVFTPIRDNISVAEAPSVKQSVITYAPRSHGAIDYTNLAKEIIRITK